MCFRAAVLLCFALAAVGELFSAPSCVCDTRDCDDVESAECPGLGIVVWDPCKCCKVCARTEGEPCGGELGFSGSCEPGLGCRRVDSSTDVGICQRQDL